MAAKEITAEDLTAAQLSLVLDLDDSPIPYKCADLRRPFADLCDLKVIKHNGWTTVDGQRVMAYALRPLGYEIANSIKS